MPDFDDKICPRRTAAPPSCSAQQGESKNVLYAAAKNDVICHGGIYTVGKKAILSVCCAVKVLNK
jgi:hypothetical protein